MAVENDMDLRDEVGMIKLETYARQIELRLKLLGIPVTEVVHTHNHEVLTRFPSGRRVGIRVRPDSTWMYLPFILLLVVQTYHRDCKSELRDAEKFRDRSKELLC